MPSSSTLWCVLASLCSLAFTNAGAQTGTTTNLYRITSGTYRACCGIGGGTTLVLPNESQAFVFLSVDYDTRLARMTIVGEDLMNPQVFRSLENGRLHPDYIEFGAPGLQPRPGGVPVIHYVVSNRADGLRFSGVVLEPPTGADQFYRFSHTNVVAVRVASPPVASIHVSEIEVCWPSVAGSLYEVQYRSALTANEWVRLGEPVTGNGLTNCVPDRPSPGEPRRFYRIVAKTGG